MDHIGIDVHRMHRQICILSEDGELSERRIRNWTARALAAAGCAIDAAAAVTAGSVMHEGDRLGREACR